MDVLWRQRRALGGWLIVGGLRVGTVGLSKMGGMFQLLLLETNAFLMQDARIFI
jgi:hypothetical protein